MASASQRVEPVSLRLTRDERQMLKGLAAAKGVSQSDVLRMLLREAWAKQQETAAAKRKR